MSTEANGPGMEQIKASLRAQWMSGDFGVIARTISSAAEGFVRRLALPAGTRVLDVACGTGNLAIPLARSGCVVTGLDIASNLLAQARERAAEEGLEARFDEGDAEQMPYEDASFDAALTMFGAMFAPRPELVVSELARVLKPGGQLAMANWNPDSFSGAMFQTSARHAPPPREVPPPVLWGDPTVCRQRLSVCFEKVETRLVQIDFDLPMSPGDTAAFFRQYFGPTQAAFNRLDAAGQQALEQELEVLWAGANVAPDPPQHTLVRNEYLEVRAHKL